MKYQKVLAHKIPHPFFLTPQAGLLNNEAFKYIDGEGPYVEVTWRSDGSNFEPDINCGSAEDIHRNDELYEDAISITLVNRDYCVGYIYPKEYFSLVKDSLFDQKALRERYPKEYIRLLFP